MKKTIFLLFALFVLGGCGFNKQFDLARAFEDCNYSIVSADSLYVANVNISKISNIKDVNLANMPGLALAYLRKDIPLKGKINLQITNPSSKDAGINQFEYKVLVKGRELAAGFVNSKVLVPAGGGSAVVPINVNTNIYDLVSDAKTMSAIGDFLSGAAAGGAEKKETVTIKIKPTLDMMGKQLSYPGFITIDKEISNKILM